MIRIIYTIFACFIIFSCTSTRHQIATETTTSETGQITSTKVLEITSTKGISKKKISNSNTSNSSENYKGSHDSLFVFQPDTMTVSFNNIDTITTITKSTTTGVTPVTFKADVKVEKDAVSSTVFQNCFTRTIVVDASSSTFMNADYASQSQFIAPGLIYEYQDFVRGNYRQLNYSRYPIVLSTDNPNIINGSSFIEVENPNSITIREGISKLYSRFNPKENGSMNLRYQTFEATTSAELTLRIYAKATAKSLASSLSMENEYYKNSKEEEHRITIDVIKPLFTIDATKKNSTNGYFTDPTFTAKNPIRISSVTYGMRVLANFTIITKSEKEWDKFKANYNSPFVNGEVNFDYISRDSNVRSTVNCYVVGGPINSTISFNKEELQRNLKELIGNVTYASARPISFTLADLAGNLIETRSATDEITSQYCIPNDNPKLKAIRIKVSSGGDGKDGDSYFAMNLFKDGVPIGSFNNSVDVGRDVNYPPNNTIQKEFVLTPAAATLKYQDLFDHGGRIDLSFGPQGDDKWDISSLEIVFNFENEKNESMTFPGITVSESTRFREFYFTKGFRPL